MNATVLIYIFSERLVYALEKLRIDEINRTGNYPSPIDVFYTYLLHTYSTAIFYIYPNFDSVVVDIHNHYRQFIRNSFPRT